MQVGSFDDVVFEVSGHKVVPVSSFSYSREARYEDHEVQGNFPVSEFLAPGLRSCAMQVVLRRDLGADPVAEAEKLDDMMVEGRVGQLVVVGISFGSYTIRKLDQDWRYMARSADGPLAVNLSIEFREYY